MPYGWIFDEKEYTIATETIDTILGKGGESYAKSVLNPFYFEIKLEYEFDRDRAPNGYIQGDSNKDGVIDSKDAKKLSFVANSGLKIGSKAGASAGAYEVAILDVESMVAMAGGINSFKNGQVLQAGTLSACQVYVQNYVDEPLNRLMNGVGYDRRCKAQTALEKLRKLRERVNRFKELSKSLAKLDSPTLEKSLEFLDDKLLPSTSNAVERGNRRHRKMQKTVYRVRTHRHIENRIALDMFRDLRLTDRMITTESLRVARNKQNVLIL